MRRRVILIAVGAIGALFLGALVIGVLFFLFSSSSVPTDVSVIVNAPRAVPVNEPYAIKVRIQNLTAETQILDSIDVQESYLEGVQLLSTEPMFGDSTTIPLVGFQSYTYGDFIGGSETFIVELVFEGIMEGTFSGDIDICVNSATECATRQLTVVIGESSGR